MNRFADGTIRPVMVVDGRSGQGSQLTTPGSNNSVNSINSTLKLMSINTGRREAWSGSKRVSQLRRATRLATLSEGESNKRSFRNSNSNGGMQHLYEDSNGGYDASRRHYGEDHSDMEFLEIQPEDSASHHGAGENAFYYQRMGNADVMRLDTTVNRNRRISNEMHAKTSVRRSNSEPRLADSDTEQVEATNSSKSMINFPNRSPIEDQVAMNWRLATEMAQHRASQSKYVQSPILEETDSALERELQTGSSFYLRPKGFFDFHSGNRNGGRQFMPPDVDGGGKQAWHRPSVGPIAAEVSNHQYNNKRQEAPKEIKELERELPYFNNRSSFLRHKLSMNKSKSVGKKPARIKSSGKNPIQADGDETESVSSNDRSQRNSRRNSVANASAMTVIKTSKLLEDDLDSGIALNSNQQQGANSNNRSRFLEKKSIFTIAYDEVATTKIPSATDNLPAP